jgi:ribosomal protein S18 acetylase RimI-like enzyme
VTTAIEVTQLARNQVGEAGQVLARAFHEDPFWVWLLPDESRRSRVVPWAMGVAARFGHRYGDVHATAGKVQGAAIWFVPGKFPLSLVRQMLSGWILAPLKLGRADFGRFMSAVNHLEHLHKRDAPPRHWYLRLLGVDPPRQGQGLGSGLIRPVLARADAEPLPCYLETVTARNVPFYQRLGFEVVVEGVLPKGGPHFWTMKREPKG